MSQPSFPTRGVVDLGALRTPQPSDGAPTAPGGGTYVIDVGEADFQTSVIDRSNTVPVVLDLWADWCGPCKQLSPVLERLAAADQGRWLLAKIDVDANQRLAAAFNVQSIPGILAVVAGQLVPMFQGALPEQQVRQYLDELLRLAAENGVTGRVDGAVAADPGPAEPALPPELEEALDAMDRGDLDAAVAAYERALAARPGDEMARLGLAQVSLVRRVQNVDPAAVLQAAADSPDDVDAQLLAADVEMGGGDVDAAFSRLLDLVARTREADRNRAREHLVSLFELVGPDDPRVVRGRQRLTSALF